MLKIKKFNVSSLATNCYVVKSENNNAFIIDPGGMTPLLKSYLKTLNVKFVINTHGHIDHIAANHEMVKNYSVPIYIHEFDRIFLNRSDLNGSDVLGISYYPVEEKWIKNVKDGDIIPFGEINLKIIHTPGHTPGSICIYIEKENILFSGDTLFKFSIGRTDLPGGNYKEIIKSIKEKLFSLPEDTIVYPGHMEKTTIKNEKMANPFID